MTLQFIVLRISRLVQQHVNERAKNKSISRDRSDEYHTSKSRSLLMQKMSTRSLYHLFRDFQSKSRLIVNDLHRMFLEKSKSMSLQRINCVRSLRAILTNAISKAVIVSYKLALRHISMRRFYLLSKRSNSKSSNLHMLAKVFRVNFRF